MRNFVMLIKCVDSAWDYPGDDYVFEFDSHDEFYRFRDEVLSDSYVKAIEYEEYFPKYKRDLTGPYMVLRLKVLCMDGDKKHSLFKDMFLKN